MKKRSLPFPTPFEVAQLAAQLLPYTSDEANEVTAENKVVRVPATFQDRAREAVEKVHNLYGYALLYEQEELERKGNPYWPLDSKEEHDALDRDTAERRDMAERFEKLANGRPEIDAKEFMGLMLAQKRKPEVKKFVDCWKAFEAAKGRRLLFSCDTACGVGMEFDSWYKENHNKVYDGNRDRTGASRGGKTKHSNANKKHGEVPLSRDAGTKIDKAFNRLPRHQKR